MINWEELKHIHVIKRLQEILAGWYSTEIFFCDEKGFVKNYDFGDKRSFSNPIAHLISQKEEGYNALSQMAANATEAVLKGKDQHLEFDSSFGASKVLISKIASETENLGAVFAFTYFNDNVTKDEKEKMKLALANIGFDSGDADRVVEKLKLIPSESKEHFYQLVDLVAQEIVTFHHEITLREDRISALNKELGNRYRYDSMIGKSKPMQEVYSLLDKIRNTDSTILINGENGTGKELIAKAIHYNGTRKNGAFQIINCAAFNENLLESELFGHVKGAFTGAIKDKLGLFQSADKGTIFLDEIGDMPAAMQVKLLRVLQEGTFLPVGATESRKVDVRVVAATNKDLKEMIENGTFREDLYYRINVINVVVPPLRERKDDIPILVEHFIAKACKEKGLPTKQLSRRGLEKVFDYPWPGNIRELQNEMERVVVLAGDEERIQAEVLSPRIREYGEKSKVQGVRVSGKLKDALEELEKTMIREGLKRTGWNKSKLSKELGISRAGLIMKVEKYGLDKRKAPRPLGGEGPDKDEGFEDFDE